MRYSLLLAALLSSSAAFANGRPPLTNGISFQANDTHSLYVRTTFGLLISHDDGCSFRWTCEQNIGYGGMFDPTYAIASDGTIFATTFGGLRVSRDGGCSFSTATSQLAVSDPGRIADMYVDTIDLGPTGAVWVATAESGKTNDVYRSIDNGMTFTAMGRSSTTVFYTSVAIAHSDAMRIYLAGYQMTPSPQAHLYVTQNGGTSWTEGSLAGMQFGTPPQLKVAAIDPADPLKLFVISIGANAGGDRLYRSTNGGTSFAEVLSTTQPIASVVVRDAQTVLVATGMSGALKSADGGATFQSITGSPQLGCLGAGPDGSLVGCAANWDPDFMAVGQSGDAAQWHKLFRFVELDGPLACPAGTAAHDICDQQLWSGIQQQFGATGPMCASATDLPGPSSIDGVPTTKPGGCCDATDAPMTPALLTLTIAVIVFRRRTRRDNMYS